MQQSGYLLPQQLGESLKALFGEGALSAQPKTNRSMTAFLGFFHFFMGSHPPTLGKQLCKKLGLSAI
jgi:hypothetical protein